MKPSYKVLLVDPHPSVYAALQPRLAARGYVLRAAQDGVVGITQCRAWDPDLLLLEVLLPRLDGWEVCRRVRRFSRVPILMYTVCEDEDACIRGLRLGADDYVRKSVSLTELEARLEAILRRASWRGSESEASRFYTIGDLSVDPNTRDVRRDGQPVALSPIESRLLCRLAEQAGRLVPSYRLLAQVWGPEYRDDMQLLKSAIWRLRQKIEPDPAHPIYIQGRRGLGYALTL